MPPSRSGWSWLTVQVPADVLAALTAVAEREGLSVGSVVVAAAAARVGAPYTPPTRGRPRKPPPATPATKRPPKK